MTSATILYLLTTAIFLNAFDAKLKKKDFEDIAKKQNGHNGKWKAKIYDDIDYDDEEGLKLMLGTVLPAPEVPAASEGDDVASENFPKPANRLLQTVAPASLDLRLAYPKCSSLFIVRNQSACGSCWAFSVTGTAADRYCIQKGINRTFSQTDLVTCCPTCSAVKGNGCQGGYLGTSFEYMKTTGVTTGEAYADNTQCKPYFVKPYISTLAKAPACTTGCVSATVSSAKVKIASYKAIYGEIAMRNEIATYGSIAAAFTVYQDFYTYYSGIYNYKTGSALGGHAIRIVGYGADPVTGVLFWIVANSWGAGWGEKGFFRIRRGTNECNIEKYASYGVTFA